VFDVGARIKELRMAQSLSTNKLSNLAGLSQSYVRKLEKGECRPTIETVELLCHALGVTFEDFVNYKDFSLHQLRAIKIIRELNDEQLEGFCKLMDHNSSNA
jgi:transcriptional regulator with XRE-family HTH domain